MVQKSVGYTEEITIWQNTQNPEKVVSLHVKIKVTIPSLLKIMSAPSGRDDKQSGT